MLRERRAAADASLTAARIAELWYGGKEPGHEAAPGYAEEFARAIERELRGAAGVPEAGDDFKAAVLRCRYPVCKTIHRSGWGWDTSRLNEVIADHSGVAIPLKDEK